MLRMKEMKQHGFLGPIGDDIPSLIPLVVALIIFFSTFTFALNEFNRKSSTFAADRDSLAVADVLKSDSLISNYNEFDQLCKSIRISSIKFVAGIVDISFQPGAIDQLEHLDTKFELDSSGKEFRCGNYDDPIDRDLLESRSFVIFSFPIAFETKQVVVAKRLMILTWKA